MRTHCQTCHCDLEPGESRVCTPCRDYEEMWRALTPEQQQSELRAMDAHGLSKWDTDEMENRA